MGKDWEQIKREESGWLDRWMNQSEAEFQAVRQHVKSRGYPSGWTEPAYITRSMATIPDGHVGEFNGPYERQYRSVYGGPWKALRNGEWVEVDD